MPAARYCVRGRTFGCVGRSRGQTIGLEWSACFPEPPGSATVQCEARGRDPGRYARAREQQLEAGGVGRRDPAPAPRTPPDLGHGRQTLNFGFAATPATNPHPTGDRIRMNRSATFHFEWTVCRVQPDAFLGRSVPQEKNGAGRQRTRPSGLPVARLNPNGCLAG